MPKTKKCNKKPSLALANYRYVIKADSIEIDDFYQSAQQKALNYQAKKHARRQDKLDTMRKLTAVLDVITDKYPDKCQASDTIPQDVPEYDTYKYLQDKLHALQDGIVTKAYDVRTLSKKERKYLTQQACYLTSIGYTHSQISTILKVTRQSLEKFYTTYNFYDMQPFDFQELSKEYIGNWQPVASYVTPGLTQYWKVKCYYCHHCEFARHDELMHGITPTCHFCELKKQRIADHANEPAYVH